MRKLVLATVVVVAIAASVWYFAQTDQGTDVASSLRSNEVNAITGIITYTGEVPSFEPLAIDLECKAMNPEPMYPEVLVLGEGNTLANVYVHVVNPPPTEVQVPSDKVVIASQGCRRSPRIAGVVVGQTVLFRNMDNMLHNVHVLSEINEGINRGQPYQGMKFEHTFSQPEGPVPIRCDVHGWEQAYVAVVAHPYFAVTDEDGRFNIVGLPDGTYEIEAWHEWLGTRRQSVTISRSNATADFSFEAPR